MNKNVDKRILDHVTCVQAKLNVCKNKTFLHATYYRNIKYKLVSWNDAVNWFDLID